MRIIEPKQYPTSSEHSIGEIVHLRADEVLVAVKAGSRVYEPDENGVLVKYCDAMIRHRPADTAARYTLHEIPTPPPSEEQRFEAWRSEHHRMTVSEATYAKASWLARAALEKEPKCPSP